jgi:hypothetical protein
MSAQFGACVITAGHGGLRIIVAPAFSSRLSRLRAWRTIFFGEHEQINPPSIAGLQSLFNSRSLNCMDFQTLSRFEPRRLLDKLSLTLVSLSADGPPSAPCRSPVPANVGWSSTIVVRKSTP